MAKWTRERIIREILHHEKNDLPLNPSGGSEGVEPKLYRAASRIFGSWRNAILAAGLPSSRARSTSEWTAARILTVIRALARRRTPLSADGIIERYGQLVPAARRLFGSWAKAVNAAGVDPQKMHCPQEWTRERVVERILTRALRNEPLGRGSVEPRSLVVAGTTLFGSWNAALAAAGVHTTHASQSAILLLRATEPTSRRISPTAGDLQLPLLIHRRGTQWSEQEIVSAIIQRVRSNLAMTATAVHHEQRPLYRAAKAQYGSWKVALLAAGLEECEVFKSKALTMPLIHRSVHD